MRIAKYIADCGICSRRQAEKLIEQGVVSVDGTIITSPALNVDETNVVCVEGNQIHPPDRPRLWVYYKPTGLITTHKDPQGRRNVFEEIGDKLPRVISIGRLDINSEGLLLLTNNSKLARYFESPQSKIERVYKVRAFGRGRPIDIVDKKIVIDDIYYRPKLIKLINNTGSNSWYEVILTEGKNREIRNIFKHFGFEVNRLIRISYGKYSLGKLNPGEYKEVIIDEDYIRQIQK